MIINWENKPEKSIYYLGAIVIQELINHRFKIIGVDELYEKVLKVETVSYDYYFLALDWLFVLGQIELNPEGNLAICF